MRNFAAYLIKVKKQLLFLTIGFFISCVTFAQTRVTGKVTGPDAKPVFGATVAAKGTNVATTTGADGSYSIALPQNVDVLVFSFVGYEVSEVNVRGNNTVDVVMKLQSTSLNEVVVTGYSSQRKKDITGSVAVVNVASVKQIPTGSVEKALQGQASGVTVLTSGSPGGATQVRVRGITSISNTDPLVIIDGTPSSLTNINVNDVESIQVLKDAGAASIYGVRGSNGVIVVTTKKGKSGKARVSYDAYYGTQIPFKNGFNIANTQETANAIQQSYLNSGLTPGHKQLGTGNTPVIPDYITPTATIGNGPNTDPSTYALYTNQITKINKQGTVWFDEIFDPAPIQSHNLSVSSGSERSSFFFSMNYFNQQGTLLNTYLKRYSARINTTFNVANRIRIGENAYVFYRQAPGFTNQNEGNAISYSYRESPLIPIYDIMGNFAGTGSQGLGNSQNPYANLARTKDNKGNNWQVIGNVFAEVDLIKNLTVRTSFGGTIDNYYDNFFSYTQYENQENNKNPNAFTEQFGYNSSWTWTNTAQYSYTVGDHSFKALAGVEAIKNYGRAIEGRRGGYYITNPSNLNVDPALWTLSFGPPNGQTTQNINNTPYQSALYSLFGRLDYSFRDKYLLSGTVRRDGSSVFAEDQRFGVFPSVTAGWRISHEEFMKNVTWLNELKLRGGWGKLGSISNVNPTNAFNLYGQSAANSYYDINGSNTSSQLGIYASQLGFTGTTWEEDIVTNVGFDATIMRNKLDLSVEWYQKKISGLLFQPSAPPVIQGPSQPFVNAGDIQNTGIDASVTYHGSVKSDLTFDVTGTFTSYNNKVKALPPGIKYYDQNSAGSSRLGAFSRLQPGEAIGAFFGYEVVGLFRDASDVTKSATQEAAAPGRFKYRDVNGDGVINSDDRTFFGNPNPDFTAGLNIALNYKNFDFSTFLYASVGNDVLNYVRYWTDFPQVFEGAVSRDAVYNSWTPQNPDAKVPILERSSNFSTTQQFNSYYLENGSFLKMKSLILGYTLPGNLLSRFGIEKLRVYVQAANLFTITKYTGIDPELQGADTGDNTTFGIDLGNYPANQKNFNFGINLNF